MKLSAGSYSCRVVVKGSELGVTTVVHSEGWHLEKHCWHIYWTTSILLTDPIYFSSNSLVAMVTSSLKTLSSVSHESPASTSPLCFQPWSLIDATAWDACGSPSEFLLHSPKDPKVYTERVGITLENEKRKLIAVFLSLQGNSSKMHFIGLLRQLKYLVTPSAYQEKAMTPHSSTLAWKIPWMEEPGRLQSMGSRRVGHDWVTSLSLFTFMHWRKKWQPTPVFLPGESQEWGSLVGCHLWGRTESDTTEVT